MAKDKDYAEVDREVAEETAPEAHVRDALLAYAEQHAPKLEEYRVCFEDLAEPISVMAVSPGRAEAEARRLLRDVAHAGDAHVWLAEAEKKPAKKSA